MEDLLINLGTLSLGFFIGRVAALLIKKMMRKPGRVSWDNN